MQEAVGHGEIEMREVILGVGFDCFGKSLDGGLVLPFLEGLHPRGAEIGGLEQEERRRNGPHIQILIQIQILSPGQGGSVY